MATVPGAGFVADSIQVYPFGTIIAFISQLHPNTLALLAAVLLPLFSPLYFTGYRNQPQLVKPGLLLCFKLVSAGALACIETTTAIAWASVTSANWTDVVTSVVSSIAAIYLVAIINIEHRYTLASTAHLAIWFSLSLLLDWIRTQAYVGRQELHEVAVLTILASTFKALLLILNEIPKKRGIKNVPLRERMALSATSGFWSRSVIMWLDQSLTFGFRKSPQCEASPESSKVLELSAAIAAKALTVGNNSGHWLFFTIFRTLSSLLSGTLIPRLFWTSFRLSQAKLVERLLAFMNAPDEFMGSELSLVYGAIFINFGMTVSKAAFKDLSGNSSIVVRGALASAACSKTLSLPSSEKERLDASTIVGAKIEGFVDGLVFSYDIFGDSIELLVCIAWLIQRAGHTTVLLIASIAIFYTLIVSALGKYIPAAHEEWTKSSRLYVAKASQMLSQIKPIRMMGLHSVLSKILEKLRFGEVNGYKKFRRWSSIQIATATFFHAVPGPIVINRLYSNSPEGSVTATEVFSSLVIISMLYDATMTVAKGYSRMRSTFDCISSIQKFLLLEEQQGLVSLPITENVIKDDDDAMPPGRVIELKGASLAPSPSLKDNPVLQNMDLNVQAGELVMVAGPTSSGKSIFLRSIAGEGTLVSGSFRKTPGISGYCDQTPWLRYASIRDNIIGHGNFSMEWYNTVVQACLLHHDFQRLPNGDASYVGNGGSNLSNGQVYRIALARALYLQAPYLVLDNIFSVLDREVSEEIFARLFGSNGLVKQATSTIIMTTHTVPFLQQADRVFFIDLGGTVTMHTDTQSAEFRERLNSIGLPEDDKDAEQQIDKTALPCHPTPLSERVERKKGVSALASFYMTFFSPWTKAMYFICISIAVISLATPTLVLRTWLESAPGDNDCLRAYGFLSIISCVFIVITLSLWYSTMVPASILEFHRVLLSAIMRAKISFLTQTSHQSLLDFFDRDLKLLSDTLPLYAMRILYLSIIMATYMGIFATASWYNFAILPFYLGILCVAVAGYRQVALEGRYADMNCRSAMRNHLTELSAGLRHVKAFGWQEQAVQKSDELLSASQSQFRCMLGIDQWLHLMIDIARSFAMVALVILAVYRKTTMSATGMGVSIVVLMLCSDSTSYLIQDCIELDTSFSALEQLQNFVKDMPKERQPTDKSPTLATDWPHNGRVVFRDVTARYDVKSTAPPALKNVSVAITPGHKVAIVGRTGSGKSSLLMGLLNFLDYQGTIKIDGMDISTIPHPILREHITTISQDVIDLGGSLLFNLCPWTMIESETEGNVNLAGVCLVLESLNLFEVVGGIEGLYKPLSSLKLSHGQLQLVSIARGMLRNLALSNRLVIMDETTYNMDPAAAALVQNTLNDVFPDHTVITVVHDEETAMDVDLTIRMKNGHISSKVVNPNGPAARKAAEKKQADERAAAAAARRRAAAGPSAPRPPIPPHYQRLMNLQVDPDAEELARPHVEAETELRERWLTRKKTGYYALGSL